jgi:uracil-DNA glycosylase
MNWKDFIKEETQQLYFKKLSEFLVEDGKTYPIYPPHKNVFNAFKLCPLDKTKAIILGMDPYHGVNQAHGLAFSVLPDIDIPPSLRNIFKEINSDLNTNHIFSNGCLIPWAQQGILLLNTILTVRAGQPNSHKGQGWETFTDKVITLLNSQDRPMVFLLWGASARKKKQLLYNPQHLILESLHPSPLSAHYGFFNNHHFSKTNQFLIDNGLEPINWLL